MHTLNGTSRLLGTIALAITVGVAAACKQPDASASSVRGSAAATAVAPSSAALPVSSARPPMPRAPGDTLTDSALVARADAGRLMGRDSGAIWMIVISDFQCPYCKMWHDSTSAAVKREYVDDGRVRMAYLNLPLPQHPHARVEAEAGLCAAAQGKFWPYAEGLFREQQKVARLADVKPLLDSLARAGSLDMTEFARCRRSNAIKSLVESDIQQATRTGVRSTPSFLIGDFLLEGASPLATFRRAIDTALVVARNKTRGKR